MFVGSIPPELRAIIHEHTAGWDVDELYVGCSGNLTIERTLEGRFRCHSNDVSIYTSVVAGWLAGCAPDLRVRAEHWVKPGWLGDYLAEPIDRAATVMLCTRMFEGLGRRGNRYYDRMRTAYRDQWRALHGKTVDKLRQVTLSLASYTAQDVATWVHGVPEDAAICSFPPFYEGGYEALYSGLDEVFEWDAPEYEVMDRDGLHAFLDAVRQRRFWLYGTDHRLDGQEKWLRGVVQSTSRNRAIYVYSCSGATRTARPAQRLEPVDAPRLGPGDVIGDRMALAPLTVGEFNQLRAKELDPRIPPAQADLPVAVLVDGVIVGVFATGQWTSMHGGHAYLLSDFPVRPTDYPRLSKLVVAAALSTEAKALMERHLSRRLRVLQTTAFSDRPASMKYRGLLDLVGRKETPDEEHAYRLQYESTTGRWTLSEALADWREKHGRTR